MSLKQLLSDFDNDDFDARSSFNVKKAAKWKSVVLHRTNLVTKRPEVRVIKVARDQAVPYEEFLELLQAPYAFILKWSSTAVGCCNRTEAHHFELTNISGATLLKGKIFEDAIKIVDSRSRLFMVIHQFNEGGTQAILSVPNSTMALATFKQLTLYAPYNERYQIISDHFPELNCNIAQQSLLARNEAVGKYTVMSGRRVVAKLLEPTKSQQMYILLDESVSVFQKIGFLAAAIFISRRRRRSIGKYICIGVIFTIVFIAGFVTVASTVFGIRFKSHDYEIAKFPHKLRSPEEQ